MKKEAIEVLLNRRSVRKFKAEQIKKEELDIVLKAGTFAPTAMGTQEPVIIAVQNPEFRKRVSELNAKFLENGSSGDPYYGAPTIILVMVDPDIKLRDDLALLDGAAVETNMLNAAYAAGLGSCWINRPGKMFACEEGKQLLRDMGLRDDLEGIASMALGYADGDQPVARERKEGYTFIV